MTRLSAKGCSLSVSPSLNSGSLIPPAVDVDNKITIDSMKTFSEWFFTGFARMMGAVYDVGMPVTETERHQ
jgi:hypothetical protein